VTDKRDVVLDGELVALDAKGRPDFGLQRRIHIRPSDQVLAEVPVHYYVFDLLRLDGQPVTDLPYLKRHELLTGLSVDRHPLVAVPPSFTNTAGHVAQDSGLNCRGGRADHRG
jgi:bifunctional non-homologous end joining protein LigD